MLGCVSDFNSYFSVEILSKYFFHIIEFFHFLTFILLFITKLYFLGLNQNFMDQDMIYYDKQFRCPKCSSSYSHKRSLWRHFKYECGKDPAHSCPFCTYKSKQKNNLNAHIKRHHGNSSYGDIETPFKLVE